MMWWYMPVILAQGKLKQEDQSFQDSLGNTVKYCFKKVKNGTTSYIFYANVKIILKC